MKPNFVHLARWFGLWVLLLSASVVWGGSFDRGLVWEISYQDQTRAYVMGTIHSEDERLLKVLRDVEQYVSAVSVLALELNLDQQMSVELGQKMLLTDGRTLGEIVGDDVYKQVSALALRHGIPEMGLRMLKPWAAFVSLSTPPPVTGLFLDKRLYLLAKDKGKKISGLESMEEQLAVFEGLSEKEQLMLLRETVKQYDHMAPMFEKMLKMYMQLDLAGIVKLNDEMMDMGDAALNEKLMLTLVEMRNRRMVERMVPMWEKEKVFVGVGALHLVGDKGILRLLENRGYSVKRVY